MKTQIVRVEDGFGFSLVRFAGPTELMYQITGGNRLPSSNPYEPAIVVLGDSQMRQLASAFLLDRIDERSRR
jgi:hypothetical protein